MGRVEDVEEIFQLIFSPAFIIKKQQRDGQQTVRLDNVAMAAEEI
jgi:hypothetical protein